MLEFLVPLVFFFGISFAVTIGWMFAEIIFSLVFTGGVGVPRFRVGLFWSVFAFGFLGYIVQLWKTAIF